MGFMRIMKSGADWIGNKAKEITREPPPKAPEAPKETAYKAPVDGVGAAPTRAPAAERGSGPNDGIEAAPRASFLDGPAWQHNGRGPDGARASTLATEDAKDGNVNCLDQAVDLVNGMTPEERKKSELVMLADKRPGAEGRTGHVVVRQGDEIVDPSNGKRYHSSEEFFAQNPHYAEAGTLGGEDAKRIFDTPPGSPARAAALADAKVPPALRDMMVADATPGYTPAQAGKDAETLHKAIDGWGTNEAAIWRTLEGKSKEDIDLIRKAYQDKYGKNMDEALRGDMKGFMEGTKNLDKLERMLKGAGPLSPKDQAELDFAKFDRGHPAGWGRHAAELLRAHAGDKEYQAALIGLMNQGGPNGKLQESVAGGLGGLFVPDASGKLSDRPEDKADRETLLAAMKVAREAGTLTDADLQAGVQRAPGPWNEVTRALGVTTVDKPAGTDGAVKDIKTAREAHDKAKEEATKRDEWLAKQLADFGPALTPQQKQKYVTAFRNHPDNKGIYDNVDATAQKLADKVKAHSATLEAAAFADPEGAGAELKKSLDTLAGSSRAAVALEIGAKFAAADPKSPMGQVAKGWGNLEEIMAKALPNAAAQCLASEPDPEAAINKLEGLLKPLIAGGAEGKAVYSNVKEAIGAYKEAAGLTAADPSAKYDRVKHLAKDWQNAGPFTKSLAATGLIFGAIGAGKAGADGDYLKMASGILGSGEAGARMTAQILGAAANIAGDASKSAAVIGRLAPGLGALANAAAAGMNINKFVQEENPGYLIAAAGDAISAIGAGLEVTPLAPLGLAINGFGALVSAVGHFSVGKFEEGKLDKERERYLKEAGVPDDMRKTLIDAERERIQEFAVGLEIPPEELQKLATQHPDLLKTDTADFDATVRVFKALGIKGAEAGNLLRTMGAGHEDPNFSTGVVLMNLARDPQVQLAKTPEELDRALENLKGIIPQHSSTIDALIRAGRAHRTP